MIVLLKGAVMDKLEKQRQYQREYYKKKKEGFVFGKAGRPANTPEVLWNKVDKRGKDECWPWKGHLSKKGYGRFNLGRHGTRLGLENDSVILAHRLAFLLANGELDPDLMVLHSCDFPACCNSKHLRQGPAAENSHDMASRDRSTHGERNPMVKFKEHEIIEMRVLRWVKGWTCQQIMDKFDSNVSTVSTITRGLAWERSPGPTCFEDVEDWLRQSV